MTVVFHKAILENGLTIIAEEMPGAYSASAGFFVKTGARDEAPAAMGVSHFLEHMMFKGSDRRSAEELNRAMDQIGARNNAYTTSELTCFHAAVVPERMLGEGGALDLLADMMRPSIRDADFAMEKNVILEEIAMYEDDPFWVLYERMMEEHYRGHGLAHRVLGTKETVSALQAERMRAYFFERYSADNTVLAAAGKIDFARLVEQARRQCGHWQRTGAARVPDGPARGGTEFLVRDEKVTLGYQMMLTPAPALADERRYAASLLAQVLGGADNSRLHWALVETGLAEEASAGYDPRDGVGDFMVSLASAAERVDEVWAVAEKQMAELGASLTEDDLEKIKAKAATAATTAGERPGGRMQRLGRQWTYLGTRTTLEEELARIGAVTVADLRALLEEFPLRPRTVGRLLPK